MLRGKSVFIQIVLCPAYVIVIVRFEVRWEPLKSVCCYALLGSCGEIQLSLVSPPEEQSGWKR